MPAHRCRFRHAALLTSLITLGLPGPATADLVDQSGPADLRVVVALAPSLEGRPVDVQVEAQDGTGRQRTARLDTSLVATFAGLAPGAYDVVVTMPGGPTVRSTVRVDAHEVVILEASLEVTGAASRVQLVDRHRVAPGADFDERMLQDLPGADDLWTLIETAVPFVVVDRMTTGGLGTARSALMGSRGASWTSTAVTVGDLVVQDSGRTGLLGIEPDLGAFEAVGVTSGLAPVEIATPGVAVSLVPRRPGPRLGGMVRASATSRDMVGTNALPYAPSIGRVESFRDAGVLVSGPLGGRVGVLGSAAFSSVRYQERNLADGLSARSASGFGHVTFRPADGDRLRVVASVQQLTYPFDGRRQFSDRATVEHATLVQSQAGWDHISSGGSRRSLGVAYQWSERTPSVSASTGGTVDRLLEGVLPAPAANRASSQVELNGQWQPGDFRWWGAHHSLRIGGTGRRSVLSSSVAALPAVAEQVAGLPARVWQYEMPSRASRRMVSEAAVYVADRLTLSPHLTVEAGLRLESLTGSAAGADVGLSWRTVSPRVSFRWSPAAVSVFGGYGRYAARHALSLLAFGDPGEPWAQVYRWRDDDADGLFVPAERGELVARAGQGRPVASIAPNLRSPRTQEFTAGGEIRLGRRHTFQGTLIVRRQKNLVGSINVGVPLSSYGAFEVDDENADYDSPEDDRRLTIYDRLPGSLGQDEFVLTNPPGATTTYGGIELVWRFRSERWRMLFGATAYRTRGRGANRGFGALENDQHVVGEVYEQPNATPEMVGSFFFDRSYVGKWSGSYRAPGDVRVAFAVRYQDGQPFSRVVIAPDLSTGPEMVTAYRLGQTRFTYTLTFDVRFEKGIVVAGRRAAIRLDVFNLTNHQNEVDENVVGGPTYRLSTAVQPPRTLRVGFRFDF